MRFIYVDSSAAVKLFKDEAESAALEAWLTSQEQTFVLTSDLTRTELRRALHAASVDEEVWREAESWIQDCAVVRLSTELCDQAGHLQPGTGLRSLDAIHTATALELGKAMVGFVTYDDRLAEVARAQGLPVVTPADEASREPSGS